MLNVLALLWLSVGMLCWAMTIHLMRTRRPEIYAQANTPQIILGGVLSAVLWPWILFRSAQTAVRIIREIKKDSKEQE